MSAIEWKTAIADQQGLGLLSAIIRLLSGFGLQGKMPLCRLLGWLQPVSAVPSISTVGSKGIFGPKQTLTFQLHMAAMPIAEV